ncbi:MAG: PrgI family protein [Patescibacteria group bacterium]
MRFEVPQFIEIEDKIFGPLSWRQFVYLGGGVGIAVVLYLTLPFILFVVLGLPIAALAGALAFYPVNERPFSYFLEAIFTYISNQRFYLWQQQKEVVYRGNRTDVDESPVQIAQPKHQKRERTITSLARKLELEAMQKAE